MDVDPIQQHTPYSVNFRDIPSGAEVLDKSLPTAPPYSTASAVVLTSYTRWKPIVHMELLLEKVGTERRRYHSCCWRESTHLYCSAVRPERDALYWRPTRRYPASAGHLVDLLACAEECTVSNPTLASTW